MIIEIDHKLYEKKILWQFCENIYKSVTAVNFGMNSTS